METWQHVLMLTALLAAVIYLIYHYGFRSFQSYGVSKNIAADVFVFLPGKGVDQASISACNGWLSHGCRVPESRTYEIIFDAQLSEGNAVVFLLDEDQRPLLKLTPYFPIRKIDLDKKTRYYLHWEFQDATGKCELRW